MYELINTHMLSIPVWHIIWYLQDHLFKEKLWLF